MISPLGSCCPPLTKKNKTKHLSYDNDTDRNRKRMWHNAENKQSLVSKETCWCRSETQTFDILCFFRSVNKSFDTKFEKLITVVIFVGKKLLVIKFLVSKENVVLCWRESGTNELIKVELPL